MKAKTHKEKIYDYLVEIEPATPIQMSSFSRKVGCSISYLSSMLKYCKEAGFIAIHENESYKTLNIPDTYGEFQRHVNEKYELYRKSVSQRSPIGRKKTPENSKRIVKHKRDSSIEIARKESIIIEIGTDLLKKIIEVAGEENRNLSSFISSILWKYLRTQSDPQDSIVELSDFQLPPGGISIEKLQIKIAEQALIAARNNQTKAAELLGLTRAKFRVLIGKSED